MQHDTFSLVIWQVYIFMELEESVAIAMYDEDSDSTRYITQLLKNRHSHLGCPTTHNIYLGKFALPQIAKISFHGDALTMKM